jgi:5-methylthioribose kinase
MTEIESIINSFLKEKCEATKGINFSLEQINGGMVNFVFRIKIEADPINSFVVKHYQPYLSSTPEVPLSCERYFVEKAALQEMTRSASRESFHIPKLVEWNDENHILLLEDCGHDLKSLFDFMRSPSIKDNTFSEAQSHLDLIIDSVTGLFFLLQRVSKATDFIPMNYYSKGTFDIISDYIYGEYENRVKEFPLLQKYISFVKEEKQSFQETYQNFHRNAFLNLPSQYSLTFGDMWPSAIFFSSTSSPESRKPSLYFIDWEFTRIGHYYNDFFQLFSYLFLMQYDIHYNREHVEYLKDSLMDFLLQDPQAQPDRGGITKENVSLLLVNIALVFREKWFSYDRSEELICRDLVLWIDLLLSQCKTEQ